MFNKIFRTAIVVATVPMPELHNFAPTFTISKSVIYLNILLSDTNSQAVANPDPEVRSRGTVKRR